MLARAEWAARIAFALVFVINVQCALQFFLIPQDYVAAYELSGDAGLAAIRGIGVAFLMWNCTYPAVIAKPARFTALGWVVLAQQLVGLLGESAILFGLPAGHEMLAASVQRFIVFDGLGLLVMAVAWLVLRHTLKDALKGTAKDALEGEKRTAEADAVQ